MSFVLMLILGGLAAGIFIWIPYKHKSRDDIFMLVGISTAFYIFLTAGLFLITKQSQGIETMVLNGYVTKKEQEMVSCSHSYSCNCRVVKTGKVTSTKCDTCYRHSHDYDWMVRSSLGISAEIDRIDDQGAKEPPRYTQVEIGEPFSVEETYFSYIKASPLSVFKDYKVYENVPIPAQPKVYDYYRLKHVVDWKSEYKNTLKLDMMLAKRLATTSGKIKANAMIVFYGGSDDIVNATKVKTLGGRINDITIFIKADKEGNIQKVAVYSWSKNDIVHVKLRDDILALKKINHEKLVDIIDADLLKYYKHRSNEEFSYLEHNITLPVWYYILQCMICALYVGVNIFARFKL